MKFTSLPSVVLIVSVLTALARGLEDKLLQQDYTRRSTRTHNEQLPLSDGDVDNESRFLKSTMTAFAGQDSTSAEYIEEEAIPGLNMNKYQRDLLFNSIKRAKKAAADAEAARIAEEKRRQETLTAMPTT